MERSVLGVVDSAGRAEALVEELRRAGFARDRISVLAPDASESLVVETEVHSKAPEGVTAGVTSGGALGGALGWLVGIGSLVIPGIGPFIAAGPILIALSGAAVGAAVGGVTGALIGFGFPEYEAKLYEDHLRAGSILLSVLTLTADERTRARELFAANGAADVRSVGEDSGFMDETGRAGWILLWLLGVPIPLLLALFVLRGCT
jgi:hypothetical protein